MPPEVPAHRNDRQLVPVTPLSAMLILPVPKPAPKRKSIWLVFLRDLTFLLPIFGAGLGILMMKGQAPYVGAGLVTVCPIVLMFRLHAAYVARRERRQVAAFERWYRAHRGEYENIWKDR